MNEFYNLIFKKISSKKMKQVKRMLMASDIFGLPVKLTYSDTGTSYRTAVGGLMSLLVVSVLLTFFINNWIKMVNLEDVKTITI